jgi:hypothetical protein
MFGPQRIAGHQNGWSDLPLLCTDMYAHLNLLFIIALFLAFANTFQKRNALDKKFSQRTLNVEVRCT